MALALGLTFFALSQKEERKMMPRFRKRVEELREVVSALEKGTEREREGERQSDRK